MDANKLNALTEKIEGLITLCEHLRRENQTLRSNEQEWKHERDRLIETNDMARTRVESMIERLKALEHET